LPLWQVVSGREMFFLGDVFHHFYAFQALINRLLAEARGLMPLWNPYSFCGSPLSADPQMQVFYPVSLLHRFLDFPTAQGLYSAFHLFFGASGMAVFLSATGLGAPACAIGALAFGFGAHPSLALATPPILAAFSWLPWVAFFSRRFGCGGNLRDAVGLGVIFSWEILAGSPQYALYALVLSVIVITAGARKAGRPGRSLLPGAGLAAVTAIAVAFVLILPAAAYMLETGRAVSLSPGMINEGAVAPWNLLGFLVPLAFMPFEEVRTVGIGNLWCTLHFVGVSSFILAITATIFRWRSREAMTAFVLAGVGVVLGMGVWLPGLGVILKSLPPFSFMRHSGMWMCLADFGLAWLAAMGLQATEERIRGGKGKAIVAAWALAAMFFGIMGGFSRVWEYWYLAHWGSRAATMAARVGMALHPAAVLALGCAVLWLVRRREIKVGHAMVAVVFLAFGELAMTRMMMQPSVGSEWLMNPGPAESWLGKALGRSSWSRVLVSPRHQENCVDEGDNLDEVIRNVRSSFRSNLPAAAGFREAEGNNPLRPMAVEVLLGKTKFTRTPWNGESGAILNDLGVRYIITKSVIEGGTWRKVHEGYVGIYENPAARGPVWVIPREAGEARVLENSRAGVWRLHAKMAKPGRVVVNETLLDGWRIFGASAGATLRPYRDALISVKLPPGECDFELRYDPWTAKAGLAVSLAALAALLVSLGAAWFRR